MPAIGTSTVPVNQCAEWPPFDQPQCSLAPASAADPRTTLILRNIPAKMTQPQLIELVHTLGFQFDFVYLPVDFKTGAGLGYAFINLLNPSSVAAFYHAFHGRAWTHTNSKKVCQVAYARMQGPDALASHFSSRDSRCKPWFGRAASWGGGHPPESERGKRYPTRS